MDADRTEKWPGRGRALAKSAGAVLFVVAIGRIVMRLSGIDAPGIPLPDLPDVPDLPDLPAWAHPVVNWGTLVVVIVVVLLLARGALARRREGS